MAEEIGAARCDLIPVPYRLPHVHADARQVPVERLHAVSVVDNYRVSESRLHPGENDVPTGTA
jgi:hypothetical protein